MELGSVADWVAVILALVGLVIVVVVDREVLREQINHIKNNMKTVNLPKPENRQPPTNTLPISEEALPAHDVEPSVSEETPLPTSKTISTKSDVTKDAREQAANNLMHSLLVGIVVTFLGGLVFKTLLFGDDSPTPSLEIIVFGFILGGPIGAVNGLINNSKINSSLLCGIMGALWGAILTEGDIQFTISGFLVGLATTYTYEKIGRRFL